MKSFLAVSCFVVAVLADGPGGHHHPHPIVAPVVARPLAHAAPLVQHPGPLAPAPLPVHGPPYGHRPAYGPPPPYGGYAPVYPDVPPAYDFGYGVQIRDYSGEANFGHNEVRNGYSTSGEYRVDLPDGRTQIVTYNVGDANTGYVADVKYVPTAGPVRPAYGAPAPIVHPAPLVARPLAPLAPLPLARPIAPVALARPFALAPHAPAAPVHLGK